MARFMEALKVALVVFSDIALYYTFALPTATLVLLATGNTNISYDTYMAPFVNYGTWVPITVLYFTGFDLYRRRRTRFTLLMLCPVLQAATVISANLVRSKEEKRCFPKRKVLGGLIAASIVCMTVAFLVAYISAVFASRRKKVSVVRCFEKHHPGLDIIFLLGYIGASCCMVYVILVVRAEFKNRLQLEGGSTEDTWGFGQVLSVLIWLPAFTTFFYVWKCKLDMISSPIRALALWVCFPHIRSYC